MMTSLVRNLLFLLVGIFMILPQSSQQSIDELIAGAGETPSGFDLMFDLSGNNFLVELDMVFLKEQYEAMQSLSPDDDPNSPNLSRKKRKAIKSLSYRWKNKVIPYKIARGVFSSRDMNQIEAAINEWKTYTCIRFKEASSSDTNRVYFNNGQGCYSYVGMTGGSQTLGLAPGCRVKGVIVHEIGHAVGFHHEQNRPDRDDHVRIIRQNIPSNLYYNFKKYPWSAVTTHQVPYDYGSVMHYGGTAFSMNGQYTIRTVNPKDQNKIGNRKGLSFNDIKLANIMYKCNDGCSKNLKCPGQGFVGKDCKCWCPGNPIRQCDGSQGTTPRPGSTTTTRVITTTKPTCTDMNQYCNAWAKAGYCGRNSYVKTYCKKSCKTCPGSGGGSGKGACKDLREHCAVWESRGYCKSSSKFATFMSENCAKTCKTCTPNTDPVEGRQGGDGVDHADGAASSGYQLLVIFTTLVFAFAARCMS